MFAVLGNHDYHSDQEQAVAGVMERAGVRVLEGDGAVVTVGACRVGVAGIKGFGGGFAGACGSEFGEPVMKAFIAHTRRLADRLEAALAGLAGRTDLRVALVHYSPTERTLQGERLEIYPFLGSYLLGEAIDRARRRPGAPRPRPRRHRAGLDRRWHRGAQRRPAAHRPSVQRVLPAPPARPWPRRPAGGGGAPIAVLPAGQRGRSGSSRRYRPGRSSRWGSGPGTAGGSPRRSRRRAPPGSRW